MTTTTTYQDQHTPAKADFFVPDISADIAGARMGPLCKLQNEMTKAALLADANGQAMKAAFYRDTANAAGAAAISLGVVDELMARTGKRS